MYAVPVDLRLGVGDKYIFANYSASYPQVPYRGICL